MSAQADAALSFDRAGFTYAGAREPALADVSLSVPAGQCVVLTGGSGCGKTTLTRLANGLIPVSYDGELAGSVRIAGKDAGSWEMDALCRRVGSVFQNPRSQFFNLDTTSEVAFGCENLGLSRAEMHRRVDGAFALLGIGNTLLQVSLNPLLTNVVRPETLTSSLTAGQVVKAVSSFCGPFIAAFAAGELGDWQYLFPIYAAITLLSALWLLCTPIRESRETQPASSVGAAFSLLKDRTVLILFLGIVFVVGVDVGMNTVAPKLLIERSGYAVEQAGIGSIVYFVCRTVGALLGSLLLVRMSDVRYFRIHIFAAIAAMIALWFTHATAGMLVLVGLIGFACSSIFSVIYSAALKSHPDKANESSGLMITGVCGGAVIPPLMGASADFAGSQIGSLVVIGCCMAYLAVCALLLRRLETGK